MVFTLRRPVRIKRRLRRPRLQPKNGREVVLRRKSVKSLRKEPIGQGKAHLSVTQLRSSVAQVEIISEAETPVQRQNLRHHYLRLPQGSSGHRCQLAVTGGGLPIRSPPHRNLTEIAHRWVGRDPLRAAKQGHRPAKEGRRQAKTSAGAAAIGGIWRAAGTELAIEMP